MKKKYLLTSRTSYSLRNVKLQFQHFSRLSAAEELRNTVRTNIDILELPFQGTDVAAIIPTAKGSLHYKTTVNTRVIDSAGLVFSKADNIFEKHVLDFDSLSSKNLLRVVSEPNVLIIDDPETHLFQLSGKINEYWQIAEDRSSFTLLHDIRHFLFAYHSLLDQVVEKHLKAFEIVFRTSTRNKNVDFRRYIRRVSYFLFKCLPDFSGSEEEEAGLTYPVVKSFPFTSKQNLSCYIIPSPYYKRSIPLSNLRMTG